MENYSDVETNTKVQEIIRKIQLSLEKLEKSYFYTKVMKQMQNPEMLALIERVIGTDPDHSQLQIVLYGIGKMDTPNVERNHMQFCLAILLRKNFQWVHDIVVFDPKLSTIEKKAINAFDCNCLSVNENGRRTVNKPTLFYMPHCELFLMDNVLEANWSPENLNKIIILGNCFKSYDLYKETFAYYRHTNKMQVILNSDHMLHAMPLPQRTISLDGVDDLSIDALYGQCFSDLSWHFFDWDGSLHGFQRQDPKMFAPNCVKNKRMAEEIIKKIHLEREMLEKSSFYRKFVEQMEDPEMVSRIENVIGTDPHDSKLQVVLLGIGVTEPKEHMQLAFALLLREKFRWVTDIMLYVGTSDSTVEKEAVKALNCSFLSENKSVTWTVNRPTLFFMSGSQISRYITNILQANWTPEELNKIIILGQSFQVFTQNNELLLHEIPLPQTSNKIPGADSSTPPNKDCSVDPDSVYRPKQFFMSGSQIFRHVKNILQAIWKPAELNTTMESKTVQNNELHLHEMPLPDRSNKIPCGDIRQNKSTPPNKDCSDDPDSVYMEAFNGFSWQFFANVHL